jgi:sulfur carrier protein
VQLTVNGETVDLVDGATIAGLLQVVLGEKAAARGSAVAVDGSVVPRSAWAQVRLAGGEAVEIVTAAQGG